MVSGSCRTAVFLALVLAGHAIEASGQTAKLPLVDGRGFEIRRIKGPSPEQVVDVNRMLDALRVGTLQLDPRFGSATCAQVIKLINRSGGIDILPAGNALIAKFDQDCLGGADTLPDSIRTAGVDRIVGVVSVGKAPICTGFRVAANLAMTAKHCFYDQKNGEALFGTNVHDVSFQLMDTPGSTANAEVLICLDRNPCTQVPPYAINASVDVIYLRLSGAMPSMPALRASPTDPSPNTALVLLGYWDKASGTKARDKMRWSKNAQCITPLVRRHCLYHTCQAVNGFSGAGMFVEDAQGGLEVAGIHLAGAGTGYFDCPGDLTSRQGNIGLRLSQLPSNP